MSVMVLLNVPFKNAVERAIPHKTLEQDNTGGGSPNMIIFEECKEYVQLKILVVLTGGGGVSGQLLTIL